MLFDIEALAGWLARDVVDEAPEINVSYDR